VLSSGVLTLVGFACLALAFAAVAGRRGIATAVVSLCWVPLVALILGIMVLILWVLGMIARGKARSGRL